MCLKVLDSEERLVANPLRKGRCGLFVQGVTFEALEKAHYLSKGTEDARPANC